MNGENKFLVCPTDGRVIVHNNCLGCDNLAQIQIPNEHGIIQVECIHNFKSHFLLGKKAEELGD